jgi:hypothetical protein
MSDSDMITPSEIEDEETDIENTESEISSEEPVERLEDKFYNDLKGYRNDVAAIRKYANNQPLGIKVNCRELNSRIPLGDYRFRMANDKLIVAKKPKYNYGAKNTESNKELKEENQRLRKIIDEHAAWINGIVQIYHNLDPQLFEQLKQYHDQYIAQAK